MATSSKRVTLLVSLWLLAFGASQVSARRYEALLAVSITCALGFLVGVRQWVPRRHWSVTVASVILGLVIIDDLGRIAWLLAR